jgi:ElaB/YqjD/DUF883 family membrane-anchored ribosome-binding protein
VDNQVTTPASDKTPEEIEQEMLQTRESLTEKVAALETQVAGTVQNAADTVTGTVEAVKSLITTAPGAVSDTVKQAAAAVGESMKETFDITGHVRRNPWASVGASAGLGFLVGLIVFRDRTTPVFAAAAPTPATPVGSAPRQPGVFDEFIGMIGRKAKDLAETAIESASASLMANIQEGVPKLVNDAASRLTDTGAEPDSPTFAGRFDGGRRMHG